MDTSPAWTLVKCPLNASEVACTAGIAAILLARG
jgi:hypothetical protein